MENSVKNTIAKKGAKKSQTPKTNTANLKAIESKVISKKSEIYNYPAGLSDKGKKQMRQKLRNKLSQFIIKDYQLRVEKKGSELITNNIQEFNKFYKSNYITQDFTLNSLREVVRDLSKEKDTIEFLKNAQKSLTEKKENKAPKKEPKSKAPKIGEITPEIK